MMWRLWVLMTSKRIFQIEPHISSVHVEKEELGTVAVRHLVEMIKNGTLNHSKTVLPVRLVLRRSTGDQL